MNQCSICERSNVQLHDHHLNGRVRGKLCRECTAIVSWVVENGWIANKCMRYLMGVR